MNLSTDEGLFSSWMEETLQFDLEPTQPGNLQFRQGVPNVRSFSKSLIDDADLTPSAACAALLLEATPANVSSTPAAKELAAASSPSSTSLKKKGNVIGKGTTPTSVRFIKEASIEPELVGSPEPSSDGDEMDDTELPLKWEDELSQLVESSSPSSDDREVPMIDENTKDLLVNMPVKDFNQRVRVMKLDDRVLQHLKLCRKRLKNRQAAIRSRSKKENETMFLQKRVDELVREREQQNLVIKQLQQRLAAIEKQVKS